MKVLHTQILDRFLGPLAERLAVLEPPVGLAPLGSAPSPVLLISSTLSGAELASAQAAGVRWIQAVSAGVEHILIPELVATDIILTTSGGASATPIAEFVFSRILEHAKELPRLAAQQQAHLWKVARTADVAGATLAVVGFGAIGRRVAQLGQAFGMKVIVVRRRPEAGGGSSADVVGIDQLPEALSAARYVVLAPPLTPETRGLIGAAELAAMRDGALLVNVGRGALVDEAALMDATRDGRIGAVLDVVAEEPLPPSSPLWDCASIAISPHCSAFTPSMIPALADVLADNVRRFVSGEPLRYEVDKDAGYHVAAAAPG